MKVIEFRRRFPNHFDKQRESRPLIKPNSEDAYQAEVVKWAKDHEELYPELSLLYAIPNGANKSRAVRAVMWLTGTKSGVPDLCLPVARRSCHGLYIEMKTEKGKTAPAQKEWLAKLRDQGYRALVCKTAIEAIAELRTYLGIPTD